ncbi:nucleic acid-binding protein [Pleurocapsa sp. CCALA 161]|uniref:nucleic acid-binding protein n=1 Tax=Pleurocapsa sp. CCALA 161 TaxID=2107688 RepID=UPI000D06D8F0|nr:nucleic acid-binding protein [Pleurocapsa sp. CCALA 161]PSB09817.1 nucleic acid-binding protein [Pleurocapsa sp. CCALA 161]
MIVLVDSGILGKLCNPNSSAEVEAAREKLYKLLARGVYIVSSQICDYEVRRSLILNSMRGLSSEGISNLDKLSEFIDFLPVNNTVLQEAANLWAEARIQGVPTADDKSLDADIIICAQYKLLKQEYPGRYIIIATTNVKHLSRFTEAKEWQAIEF